MLYDYNMDLDQVEAAISERTQAIIATHLFGYPLNVDRLCEIVDAAEARWGHKIWVIQDCAHAFGARWQGKLVCNEGDAALFGLNISKMITSMFGGMITTHDIELSGKLRAFRDEHFVQPGLLKRIRRLLYLLAVYPAFHKHVYGLINRLEEETSLLDYPAKAYHLDKKIHFPPDYLDQMLHIEAQVGLLQLSRYPEIVRRREDIARYYDRNLQNIAGLTLPPIVEGASYSHYVPRLAKRDAVMDTMRRRGVQLGRLIDYSIPHMANYQQFEEDLARFPNSVLCSTTTINLPEHPGLTEDEVTLIVSSMRDVLGA